MLALAPRPAIADPHAARALFAGLADAALEVGAFAYLGRDLRLLGMRHVASPHRAALDVPVRSVVADALAFDAAALVMGHNHPSGEPTPSPADRALTRQLLRALDAVGVRLLDHLVLARGGTSTSFRALGWL